LFDPGPPINEKYPLLPLVAEGAKELSLSTSLGVLKGMLARPSLTDIGRLMAFEKAMHPFTGVPKYGTE